MAAKPPKVNIRGIRASMPQGYLLGRLDKGFGPAQLISLRELQTFISGIASGSFTLDVQDEGASLTLSPTVLNFVGVGVTATAVADVVTITIPGYTDEQAEDAVGNILTDTAEVNFTYNDFANIITADLINNSIVAARLHATSTAILFGRATAAAGAGEEIALGSNLSLAGNILNASSGGGMLPLVSGDLPGPSLIADGSGQCIGVPL